MKTLTIKENDVNQRLDKFLRKALPKLSLPSIFKYIRNKTIKVNGKHSEIGYKVQLNDKIDIYLNDDISSKEQKNNDFMLAKDEFDVVYEDKNIIVVNKPVGVVVQDDISKTPDTLCNRLLKYLYRKKE
jgi:23S rRNA pseudouridine955/2504/2580 synthase